MRIALVSDTYTPQVNGVTTVLQRIVGVLRDAGHPAVVVALAYSPGGGPPGEDELGKRLERLRGEIELPIPAASAVKIGGERAYRLARRGVEVEMPLRRSTVHALDVIAYTGTTATLDLRVSSGTYVRAIAEALGGHCTALRRTEVGPFSVEDAVAPIDFEPGRLLAERDVLERVGAAEAEA